jgi:hypothetical protein
MGLGRNFAPTPGRACPFKNTAPQGCQIFLATTVRNGENIPKDHKIYKSFCSKALKNVSKLILA